MLTLAGNGIAIPSGGSAGVVLSPLSFFPHPCLSGDICVLVESDIAEIYPIVTS